MDNLLKILGKPGRLSLGGTPPGADAIVLGRVVAGGRTLLHIARDDARMATLADALAFFHPGVRVLTFPAWDCLPYDRVSPAGEVVSRRLDTLTNLAGDGRERACVVLTTVNAATQRVPARAGFAHALFQAAIDAGCPVADESLACIEQHVGRYATDDFLPTPEHGQGLLTLLVPRAGLYDRLSDMHEAGLLGQLLPEFKRIDCRVVRDFYHKYTVDEHTLLTIRNLERLTTATPERARFGRLLGEVQKPELLVLALLYHDIGKWKDDDDHAAESERLIATMCERLDMAEDDRDTVRFLVGQHLKM